MRTWREIFKFTLEIPSVQEKLKREKFDFLEKQFFSDPDSVSWFPLFLREAGVNLQWVQLAQLEWAISRVANGDSAIRRRSRRELMVINPEAVFLPLDWDYACLGVDKGLYVYIPFESNLIPLNQNAAHVLSLFEDQEPHSLSEFKEDLEQMAGSDLVLLWLLEKNILI